MNRLTSLALCFALGCGGGAKPTTTPTLPDTTTKVDDTAKPVPKPAVERWSASLVIGTGFLEFVVEFTGEAEAKLTLEGKSIPLAKVTYGADAIAFSVEKPTGEETWEHYQLKRQGEVALGVGVIGKNQSGALPIRMVKLKDGEAPHTAFPRPTTPVPPFPYDSRELEVVTKDGAHLAGTLALPKGDGPFPVVILLSGSGQQDRDETIYGHKTFLVIADKLARAGIASYRFDDRGAGKTTGAPKSLETEIADAGEIIDALKKDKSIDPKRVGLLAHSASGQVAPNAALKHPVAFIALLAGTTLPGTDYAAFQTQHAMEMAHMPADQMAEAKKSQDKIAKAIVKGKAEIEKVANEIVKDELKKAMGRDPTPEELKMSIAAFMQQAASDWTISYFQIDPRTAWKRLSIPTLLLVGDKDTQVPADMTVKALTAVVAKKNLTTKVLPGLNHLFQQAKTGELDEYLLTETSIDPVASDALVAWVTDVTKKK